MPWDSSSRAKQLWPPFECGPARAEFDILRHFRAAPLLDALLVYLEGHARRLREDRRRVGALTEVWLTLGAARSLFDAQPARDHSDVHEQATETSATNPGEDSSTPNTESRGETPVATANSKKRHRDKILDERPDLLNNRRWLWNGIPGAGFGSENRLSMSLQ
jgi:hypothetical protein